MAENAELTPREPGLPERASDVVVDTPLLRAWRPSTGFAILGLLVGWPLVLLFSAMLVDLLTGLDADQPLLRVIVALIVMGIYAATAYPSYFTEKPLLKSNRAISFANLMFGSFYGFAWNSNLTKKTRGSTLSLLVGVAVVCAFLAFSVFSSLRFHATPSSTATRDYPPNPPKSPVAVTPTPPAFAPPTNWSVAPLKRTGDARVYTDAETGASFVVADSWSEEPLQVDKSWQTKFRVLGNSWVFYGSAEDHVLRMDDASAKVLRESMRETMPNATVERAALNGVEYLVGSGSATDAQSGLAVCTVHLVRVENGHAYNFKYSEVAGNSTNENLQAFFSMVASTVYP